MKNCLNCQSIVKEGDIYCRHCGCLLKDDKHYVLTNVLVVFAIIGIILLIFLFIASYIVGR